MSIILDQKQCKKILMAILLDAIADTKGGCINSANWLTSDYACQMATSLGFNDALWRDEWGSQKESL